MHLPSKELLSKVLGVYVTEFFLDCESLVYVYDKIFNENEQYKNDINIYELAHKCKEWALFEGHILSSWMTNPMNEIECYCKSNNIDRYPFQANTEPEAIFKACEWILENKDK